MGKLAQLFTPQAAQPGPLSDFWYEPVGYLSSAGIRVDQETAMKLSAVWRCVSILAGSVAMLPLKVYRVRPDGGKDEARDHPLWEVLHDQPNRRQTSYQFRELLMKHALLRGNGYARIVPGPRGMVDQLIPIHPDRVRVERVRDSDAVRYFVRDDDGLERVVNDDDMFHVMGPSDDGIVGLSWIEYARRSVGLAVAHEEWGANFYRQAPRPGGMLEHPGKLSPEAKRNLLESLREEFAGHQHVGRLLVLEEGMKWQSLDVGLTAEDAEFIAAKEHTIQDIARWFGVPNHMIGETTKETSWGSGIEQLAIGFVRWTLMPWLKRWESTIKKDLIIADQLYFAEFEVQALLQGDTRSRYEAYQIAAGGNAPWMSRNEIRRRENLNPLPELDEMLQPLNMTTIARSVGPAEPRAQGQSLPSSPSALAQYQLLVQDQAKRVVRRELFMMGKAAKQCASDRAMWQQAVEEFYAEHAAYVAETLHIGHEAAQRYCQEQRDALLFHGAAVMEDWETRRADDLAQLAMEANHAAANAA